MWNVNLTIPSILIIIINVLNRPMWNVNPSVPGSYKVAFSVLNRPMWNVNMPSLTPIAFAFSF